MVGRFDRHGAGVIWFLAALGMLAIPVFVPMDAVEGLFFWGGWVALMVAVFIGEAKLLR